MKKTDFYPMLQPKPQNIALLALNMVLAAFFYALVLMPVPAQAQDRTEQILQQYKEPQRSELRRAIQLTKQKHPGKVVNANIQTHDENAFYQIRMLLRNGHMRTFSVDKNISKVEP